jgi:hypothetical protein
VDHTGLPLSLSTAGPIVDDIEQGEGSPRSFHHSGLSGLLLVGLVTKAGGIGFVPLPLLVQHTLSN